MFAVCAVCAEGYGRGVANACHECTESFKGGMYFVMALAMLLTIIVGTLLAIYLVSGEGGFQREAVNSMASYNLLVIPTRSCLLA